MAQFIDASTWQPATGAGSASTQSAAPMAPLPSQTHSDAHAQPVLVGQGDYSQAPYPAAQDAKACLAFEEVQLRGQYAIGLTMAVEALNAGASVHGFRDRLVKSVLKEAEGLGSHVGTRCFIHDSQVFALLTKLSVEDGKRLVERLLEEAQADGRFRLSIGLAESQMQPIFFETLIEVSLRAVEVALAAGGDRMSQTDLYRLVQRRFERDGQAAQRQMSSRAALGELAPEVEVQAVAVEEKPQPVPAEPAEGSLTEQQALEMVQQARREFEEQAMSDLQALRTARQQDQSTEVTRLERRVAKLAEKLEQAEKYISDLRSGNQPDPGVASIYRDVQGLDGAEENCEQKRELLETVFVSNRQLLDMIREREGE